MIQERACCNPMRADENAGSWQDWYLELPYDCLQQRPRLLKFYAADVVISYAHVGECVPVAKATSAQRAGNWHTATRHATCIVSSICDRTAACC